MSAADDLAARMREQAARAAVRGVPPVAVADPEPAPAPPRPPAAGDPEPRRRSPRSHKARPGAGATILDPAEAEAIRRASDRWEYLPKVGVAGDVLAVYRSAAAEARVAYGPLIRHVLALAADDEDLLRRAGEAAAHEAPALRSRLPLDR